MREIDVFSLSSKRSSVDRLALINKPSPPPGYGIEYWDDPTFVGYGGYCYDGRYKSAASKFSEMYGLTSGSKVLEIGCAKGFLLYEFYLLGMQVVGLDASHYAVANSKEEIRNCIKVHSSPELPFPDNMFDLVVAKEVLPHLVESEALNLISEINRVGAAAFLEIQCADTPESAALMKRWDISHQTIKPANWWRSELFRIGYRGDYHCRNLF